MSSQIAVLGAGYVGLTTAACLAHLQHTVVCVDVNAERVAQLQDGKVPILEQGLDELVTESLRSGTLRFTTDVVDAVSRSEFVYLAVPTPQGLDGSADLSYIEAAARQIAPHLESDSIVINKSTVPVGSTNVVGQVLGRGDVYVVSNPEFLREGSAVHDFLNPDRVVIGCSDQAAAIRVASLYMGLTAPIMVTDPASAELIKYASNAFLATKVSFVNAIAAVCEGVGADVNDVVLGMGYDKRIGKEFLRPGPGWGGSCLLGDETVLVRRGDSVSLRRLDDLFAEVDRVGPLGWEVLSWRNGEPTPEFMAVAAFTARPYDGDVVDVRTKMGRRLTVTADHPFVVGDGVDGESTAVKLAADLTTTDWLPLARHAPLPSAELSKADGDRVLAAFFDDELRLGADAYSKRLPDIAWQLPESHKRALLRGLWDADGSWSWVNRSANVVLEYGTVSRELADGMLRMLGDLGIVARLKVGRTAKSTVDTYWLAISGADQVERAHWLLPDDEWARIRAHALRLTKRNAPNGYRLLSKNAAWVRVVSAERRHFNGTVYSLEVPLSHTIVASHGLITHNCFPKDTHALVHIADEGGYDFDLLRGVIAVNEEQFVRVVDKVLEQADGSIDGMSIAAWGITFKARTDDTRDSPAVAIINRLVARGANVRAYDPAIHGAHPDLPNVEVVSDAYAACEGASVLVVLTEWDEFRWLDFDKVANVMGAKRVVDTRNLLDRQGLTRRGFSYSAIGRG